MVGPSYLLQLRDNLDTAERATYAAYFLFIARNPDPTPNAMLRHVPIAMAWGPRGRSIEPYRMAILKSFTGELRLRQTVHPSIAPFVGRGLQWNNLFQGIENNIYGADADVTKNREQERIEAGDN